MFFGSIVALITPLTESSIDIDALNKLLEIQKSSKTDAVVVLGSTGQGMLLSGSEREIVIRESVNSGIRTIVGCSGFSTNHTLEFVLQAQELKADGVLILPPPYCKPSRAGIVSFFEHIHNQSNIPIIMYNNPARSSVEIHVDDVVELSYLKRIVGIKDSTTDLFRILSLKNKINVFAGDDINVPNYLINGAAGMITVASNIVPQLYRDLFDSYKVKDFANFLKTNEKISRIISFLNGPNPSCVQYAMSCLGLCKNIFKDPISEPSAQLKNSIENGLAFI